MNRRPGADTFQPILEIVTDSEGISQAVVTGGILTVDGETHSVAPPFTATEIRQPVLNEAGEIVGYDTCIRYDFQGKGMSEIRSRIFGCDCGSAYHSLHVGSFYSAAIDEVELYHPTITFSVVSGGPEEGYGLRARLRAAWSVVFGRHHVLSEIILSREDWPEFVAHVNAIDAASAAVRERFKAANR